MFNLLPDNLRKIIVKEYSLRRAIVILFFIIFIQISFMVFLMPTWLISTYKEEDVVLRGADMNGRLSNLNIASTTDDIKSLNNKVSVIQTYLDYPGFNKYLTFILSKQTKSILIKNIAYSNADSKSVTISVDGTAATREVLRNFVKSLQTSESFKSVDIPISNYAKEKDLVFTIKITVLAQ